MREEAPSLDSAFGKLRRGLEHFNSIEQASDVAVKASAKAPFVEDDGDWKVVGINLGKFPIRPSIISGDMVHNLRSALDHAVWQLVKVSGGQPGSWTYFPIYGNKDDFINDVQQRAKKRGRGPLHGIEKRAGRYGHSSRNISRTRTPSSHLGLNRLPQIRSSGRRV